MGQTPLALEEYTNLTDAECEARIIKAKAELGDQLVILGHHYQREEVFQHADITGDSLKLARQASESNAKYIVFCGVHFMAEVADILSRDEQIAILPDLTAGCSMADMANLQNVERAWQELGQFLNPDETITPVTYINSAADLKAFCGQHGGIVCTSSNARKIVDWSFGQREKILFFPDQHLGRYTAYDMGLPLEQMVVWDFDQPNGGLTQADIDNAKMILWKGYCGVHQVFQVEHIEQFRAKYPNGKVISHPECSFEVCQHSDAVGSTENIIKTIKDSPAGTHWLVGTEINLVERVARLSKAENKTVEFMSPITCNCSTMYRIAPQNLLWTLENLVAGQVVNQITVPPTMTKLAKTSLERMLAVS